MSLESGGIDVKGKKAIVLGVGGAVRANTVEIGLAVVGEIVIGNRNRTMDEAVVDIFSVTLKQKWRLRNKAALIRYR